ncbi:MAG: hypothetical protein LBQ05_02720 [Christensenellaceae bacterium]|jgi:hypothetical protein|nr:hypothetical protein [Christensenellaceae bacterium]
MEKRKGNMDELYYTRGIKTDKKGMQEYMLGLIEIDKAVYEMEMGRKDWAGNLQDCLKWVEKEPAIYTLLCEKLTNKIVGYNNFAFLDEKNSQMLENGAFGDMETTPDNIAKLEKNKEYNGFHISMAVMKEHRGVGTKKLINDFMNRIVKLKKDFGIQINKVYGEAVSQKGREQMQKLYNGDFMVGSFANIYKKFETTKDNEIGK